MSEYSSQPTLAHNDLLLTGSYQYSSQISCKGFDQHELLIKYDPDTDSTNALNLIVEVSYTEYDTAAASSVWIQLGTLTDTSGTLTFTPYVLSEDSSSVTSEYLHWSFNVQCKKLRIGVKETNTPADFGNVTVWHFARCS